MAVILILPTPSFINRTMFCAISFAIACRTMRFDSPQFGRFHFFVSHMVPIPRARASATALRGVGIAQLDAWEQRLADAHLDREKIASRLERAEVSTRPAVEQGRQLLSAFVNTLEVIAGFLPQSVQGAA